MARRPIMHIDIPPTDRAATGRFYAELFGWQVRHDELPYSWFQADNISGGFPDRGAGLAAIREVLRAGDVVLYLPSDDIAADLERIEALGGTVLLPRTQAGEGHYVAIFSDPNGVRLGLAGGN